MAWRGCKESSQGSISYVLSLIAQINYDDGVYMSNYRLELLNLFSHNIYIHNVHNVHCSSDIRPVAVSCSDGTSLLARAPTAARQPACATGRGCPWLAVPPSTNGKALLGDSPHLRGADNRHMELQGNPSGGPPNSRLAKRYFRLPVCVLQYCHCTLGLPSSCSRTGERPDCSSL